MPFRCVHGVPEPGRYRNIAYVDHRGHSALRVQNKLIAIADSMPMDRKETVEWYQGAYRGWLVASASLYPKFWRELRESGGVTFVCDCGRKQCHLPTLAAWLCEHGAVERHDIGTV